MGIISIEDFEYDNSIPRLKNRLVKAYRKLTDYLNKPENKYSPELEDVRERLNQILLALHRHSIEKK